MAYYEEQLANNTNEFLNRYFIICGDWGKHLGSGEVFETILEDKDYGGNNYHHVKTADRVSYYKLLKDDFYLGETLKLDLFRGPTMPAANLKASGIAPMFYLPYKKNGLTRMKLSRPAGNVGPDVNFFATATIDGCSVYVEGDRTSPKVAHLNASSVSPTKEEDTEAEKQPKIQAKILAMNTRFGNVRKTVAGAPNPVKAMHRPHYLVEGNIALNAARQRFANMVQIQLEDIHDCQPCGSVIGLRDTGTGNWTLYYQKALKFNYISSLDGKRHRRVVVEGSGEFWPGGVAGAIIP